jgi:hypothetical protein
MSLVGEHGKEGIPDTLYCDTISTEQHIYDSWIPRFRAPNMKPAKSVKATKKLLLSKLRIMDIIHPLGLKFQH